MKTGTELPCDLTFVIEGEEEVGSKSLAAFLKKYSGELKCDAVVVSDTGIPSVKHPALTYALRGIASMELTVHGPSRDLHSGIFGGSVKNPAMALAELLAKVCDKNGRILIPGFYDDVTPLSAFERKQLARLPGSDAEYRKFLGVPQLSGERGFTPREQSTSPSHVGDQLPNQRLPGRRQQNHRSCLGAREDHHAARAAPKSAQNN